MRTNKRCIPLKYRMTNFPVAIRDLSSNFRPQDNERYATSRLLLVLALLYSYKTRHGYKPDLKPHSSWQREILGLREASTVFYKGTRRH